MTRRAPAKAPAPVGTGVGPSGAPKRRKRAPAGPASYRPHEAVVLAIDPGASSGYAVLRSGWWSASGVLGPRATHADRVRAVSYAIDAARLFALPLAVVAEKWAIRWRPAGAPRESWGQWLAALAEAKVPSRRIVRVNVGRWSAKLLGAMALTTEQRQARSVAVARARFGLDVTHDEAAALLMATWGSRAAEVGRVLPKGRAKR